MEKASKDICFLSCDIPKSTEEIFANLGYGCVRLPKFGFLPFPVASHPDMLFSVLKNGMLLCDGRYFKENEECFKKSGARLCPSASLLSEGHPSDCIFDAVVFDDTVIGKKGAIAPEILAERKNAVYVKQGYALCSVLLTDKCAVTADGGIASALAENGIPTLKISAGDIVLEGYGCGFIGGASAFDSRSDTVIFFGSIAAHPGGSEILSFLNKYGHKVVFDESYPLTDFGGAKFFRTDGI